jgi:hypothetical protein
MGPTVEVSSAHRSVLLLELGVRIDGSGSEGQWLCRHRLKRSLEASARRPLTQQPAALSAWWAPCKGPDQKGRQELR